MFVNFLKTLKTTHSRVWQRRAGGRQSSLQIVRRSSYHRADWMSSIDRTLYFIAVFLVYQCLDIIWQRRRRYRESGRFLTMRWVMYDVWCLLSDQRRSSLQLWALLRNCSHNYLRHVRHLGIGDDNSDFLYAHIIFQSLVHTVFRKKPTYISFCISYIYTENYIEFTRGTVSSDNVKIS